MKEIYKIKSTNNNQNMSANKLIDEMNDENKSMFEQFEYNRNV